jgi:hypothetical protein
MKSHFCQGRYRKPGAQLQCLWYKVLYKVLFLHAFRGQK